MSGHSKFSNIKHKKARMDAQRGKIFTKLGREIVIAVNEGGSGDPSINTRLKDVIAKCKAANMPNDNIQRSINKATGEGANINYESIAYEGYGLGGVAVIVEALTDNRNRTASDVRHAFDKMGGSLGTTGCVSFLFDHKGVIVIEQTEDIDEDTLMIQVIEAGADDFESQDGVFEITTTPENFSTVSDHLLNQGYEFLLGELQLVPQTTVEVLAENEEKTMKMFDMLEDNDDVTNVYHNAVFSE